MNGGATDNMSATDRAGAADRVNASHPTSPSLSGVHSRLPSLGRRGEGWAILQVVLLAAIVATGLVATAWPVAARLPLAIAAGLLAVGGAWLFVGGITGLGRQLTPFPRPVAQGSVRRRGAYRLVRHPMYGGALLLVLAWALISSPFALLPWAVAAVFLDIKRRREESWLLERYGEYAAYTQQVRRRFVPGAW